MFYNNDPSQPQRPPVYPVYRQLPDAQPGYAVPVTNKVPSAQAPARSERTPWPQPGGLQPVPPQKPRRSRTRSAAIFALTFLLLIVFGVGLFSGWTFARSTTGLNTLASTSSPSTTVSTALTSSSAIEAAREGAIAKAMPSVVEIRGTVSQGVSLGSGVIVDTRGDIVTNNHVVDGTSSLEVVLNDGRNFPAQLIGSDPANDLAVVRIQPFTGMTVATLGDSTKLALGQEVLAIGSPLGFSGTVTSGVVSSLNRSAQESRSVTLTGLIQTSAEINPGNSGGALVDLQGHVVGIPTLSAVNNETNTPANGIGFAIPSSQVQAAMTQILG